MLRDERNEKFKKFKYIKYWLTLWVCCAMSVHLRDNPSLKSALWNSVLFVQRKKRTKQINKTLKACTWGEESNVRGYKKTMGGSRAREICKRRKVHQNMQEKKKNPANVKKTECTLPHNSCSHRSSWWKSECGQKSGGTARHQTIRLRAINQCFVTQPSDYGA